MKKISIALLACILLSLESNILANYANVVIRLHTNDLADRSLQERHKKNGFYTKWDNQKHIGHVYGDKLDVTKNGKMKRNKEIRDENGDVYSINLSQKYEYRYVLYKCLATGSSECFSHQAVHKGDSFKDKNTWIIQDKGDGVLQKNNNLNLEIPLQD